MLYVFELVLSLVAVAWAKVITRCKPRRATAKNAAQFGAAVNLTKAQLTTIIISLWRSPARLADIGGRIGLDAAKCLLIAQCSTSYRAATLFSDVMFSAPPKKAVINELGIKASFLASANRSPIGDYLYPCVASNAGAFTNDDLNIPRFRVAIILAHETVAAAPIRVKAVVWKFTKGFLAVVLAYSLFGSVVHSYEAWHDPSAGYGAVGAAATYGALHYGTYYTVVSPVTWAARSISPHFHLRFKGRFCAALLNYEVDIANAGGDTSPLQVRCFKLGATPQCPATGPCTVAASACTTELYEEYVNASGVAGPSDAVVTDLDSTSIWRATTMRYSLLSWDATSCAILDLMSTSSKERATLEARVAGFGSERVIQAGIFLLIGGVLWLALDPFAPTSAPSSAAVAAVGSSTWDPIIRRDISGHKTNATKEELRKALADGEGLRARVSTSGELLPRVDLWLAAVIAASHSSATALANAAYKNVNEPGQEIHTLKSLFRFFPLYETGMSAKKKASNYSLLSNLAQGANLYLDAVYTALGLIHITIVGVTDSDVSLAQFIDEILMTSRWYGAVKAGANLDKMHKLLVKLAEAARAACVATVSSAQSAADHVVDVRAELAQFASHAEPSAQSVADEIRSLRLEHTSRYITAIRACSGG